MSIEPENKKAERKASNEYCAVVQETTTKKTHHIYLCNEIADPHNYIDMFNTLKSATADDLVRIYVNSTGGSLHTTIQMIAAIKRCLSEVTCVLDGAALSAGAMIFLSGDDNEVNYGSYLMAHWYSSFSGGKGQEVKASTDFHDAHLKRLFREVYHKFLTEKEIDRMFAGEDFWFSAEDVIARLLARNGQIRRFLQAAKKAKKAALDAPKRQKSPQKDRKRPGA